MLNSRSNIFKYQDFINEGRIFYHPSFWEVINNISNNKSLDANVQKMARLIRLMEGDEIDKMDIGYITFSDSPKTLKFKSFDKLKSELGRKDIDINFLSRKDRELISSSLPNIKDEIKMGRLIRRILKNSNILGLGDDDLFNDKDIEKFVNVLKTEFKKKADAFDNFELVSGDDIKEYYLESNYAEFKGTLGASCMRYTNCNKYMGFYSINSDVVKLLIYKDPNGEGILGRSLVWSARDTDSNDNVTFMDMIYTVNDSDVNLFKEYALRNNWIYKDSNDSSDEIKFKGESKILEVYIKQGRYKYYPYLDTLSYYDFENGILSNWDGEFEYGSYVSLESTSGTYDCDECAGEFEVDCESCNGYGEISCDECYGEGQVDCEECDGGDIECEECDDGRVNCEECDSGDIECEGCDGDGQMECSEESCKNHQNINPIEIEENKEN